MIAGYFFPQASWNSSKRRAAALSAAAVGLEHFDNLVLRRSLDDARLHNGAGPDGPDRVRKALGVVADQHQHIVQGTALQLGEDPQRVLRALLHVEDAVVHRPRGQRGERGLPCGSVTDRVRRRGGHRVGAGRSEWARGAATDPFLVPLCQRVGDEQSRQQYGFQSHRPEDERDADVVVGPV